MMKIIDIKNIKIASLNKKFINRNFAPSKEYKTFLNTCILCCKKLQDPIDPPYKIKIEVCCYADYDNILKPIQDALEKAGVIVNDRYIIKSVIDKYPIKKGYPGSLKVWVEHYERTIN